MHNCFQEQLQSIFEVIGQTTAEQGDEFRVHISKKKMTEVAKDRDLFMPGATKTLGSPEEAERIWGQLYTFGQYGFNCSHSTAYAITGYVCAWLKHHYPTEWWTGVLRNADRVKITDKLWKYCGNRILPPDVQLSGDNFEVQTGKIRAPLRLLNGIGETAHAELVELRPFSNIREFCQKAYDRRVRLGTQVVKIKETKKLGRQEIKVLKLGRSNLSGPLMAKLIASGTCDSLFPDDMKGDLYRKLELYAETEAEVSGKKVKPVDARFVALTPIQLYQLRREILPSYTEDLIYPHAKQLLPESEFKADPGYRVAWRMPRKFDENEWCPIVPGDACSKLLSQESPPNDLSPRFKFGVVAYIVSAEAFWGGKAYRIVFDVNGELQTLVRWPSREEKQSQSGAKMPAGFVGSVSILTISRWNADKDFNIDDIRVIQPALQLKPIADPEESP